MDHTDPTAPDQISQPSVLLVDDHPANLVALEAVLETLGARSVRAQSGEAALRALTREEFAVVLIDVCMPGLDGFETVARIKRQPHLRAVPIIFITALDRDARRVAEAYAQGAADFLFKPIEPAILRAKVAVFVELFRRNQEIARLNRDLERRVDARTRDLAAANADLATSLATLRATQEQLIQSAKVAAVGSLVAGLSHELNNPLAIILAGTQTALRRTSDDHPARATLESVQHAAERCGRLVRVLLDFLRKTPAHQEIVPPGELLARVVELAAVRATEHGVRLLVAPVAPAPHAFTACLAELESALSNVVANAIDASPPGATVVLRARAVADGVELAVEDRGSGIAAEDLPRIFEPFFTTKPVGQGTGIGLSLARQIVDAHGGRLGVESAVGVGTTVRIWLPARRGARGSNPPDAEHVGSGERRALGTSHDPRVQRAPLVGR